MLVDPEFGAGPTGCVSRWTPPNIEARPVWKPMHLQPVFRDAPVINERVAETLFANGLCLPSGSSLTDADIDRVCDVIEATFDA